MRSTRQWLFPLPAAALTTVGTSATTAASEATLAKTAAQTVEARLTAARAGYIDNLAIGGRGRGDVYRKLPDNNGGGADV